jgi:DNA-binding NarL/FixJ family response regulator
MGTIGVLIADDHPVVRDGLRRILGMESDIAVVGEAHNGAETIDLIRQLKPDVVLLDLLMPKVSGLDAVRELESNSNTRILVLTAVTDRQHLLKAVRQGVHGIVSKDAPVELLLKSIRHVAAGEYWIDRELLAQAAHKAEWKNPAHFGLSQRELEIISAVVAAASNKELASKFCISELTVKRHLTNIYQKIGVSSRLELALFAISHDLAPLA